MNLDELRSRLADVDRSLIELVARRLDLAGRIGHAKRSAGLPARDFAQERTVLERAREAGREAGVDPALAEDLFLSLIRSSLALQERDHVSAAGVGDGRRALVVGGAGKMGRWFARFLASQGYAVEVADPAGDAPGFPVHRDYRGLTGDRDLIVLAAPLRETAGILEELSRTPPAGLVFDVGSLKSPLRRGLRALAGAGAKVTSIHPMFGPDTELLSGRHVIFIDLGRPDAVAEAKALFASTMAVQVDMDIEDHDRAIAYVLGLSHALNLAFFTALAESGETAPKLARLSSTTFDSQLAVAALVAQENPHLYFEIQSLNDYGTEALSALLLAVERVRSIVRAGAEEEFVGLMARGREYLAGRPKGDGSD